MICIAAAGLVATLATQSFTLAWGDPALGMRIAEDVRIEGGQLVVGEARIEGAPAGFVAPPGAVLDGVVWRYRTALPPLPEIEIGSEAEAPRATICHAGGCHALAQLLPDAAGEGYRIAACDG